MFHEGLPDGDRDLGIPGGKPAAAMIHPDRMFLDKHKGFHTHTHLLTRSPSAGSQPITGFQDEKADEHVKAAAEGETPAARPRMSTGWKPACHI